MDADRQRRDLYAISLGLLLFNLAGGSLDAAASTFFGSIHIARPWMIGVGAWLAWAYFLWRFWLAARPIWNSFLDDIDLEVHTSRRYGAFCSSIFSGFADLSREAVNEGRVAWIGNLEGVDLNNVAQQFDGVKGRELRYMLQPRSYAKHFSRTEGVRPDATPMGVLYPMPDAAWNIVLEKTPWDGSTRKTILRKCFVSAAWRQHAFSDRVLPLIIAAAAPLAWAGRLSWNAIR